MDSEKRTALLNAAKSLMNEAMAQRSTVEADYLEALRLEDSYNPDYDNDKAAWQSKVVLPDLIAHCRSVASAITRLFRAEKDWPLLIARSPEPAHQKVCDALGKVVRLYLVESGFFRLINQAAYVASLAGYCPLYVDWKQERYMGGVANGASVIKTRGRLDLRLIDPMEFWRDPTGYQRFHVVRRIVTVAELKKKAEEWGYNLPEVAKVEAGKMPGQRVSWQLDRTSNAFDLKERDKQNVELLDFCGEFYDLNGGRLLENGRFTVANMGSQDLLVMQPKEYDNLYGATPYLFLDPVNDGRMDYPISYARPYVPVMKSLSDMFNLVVDIAHESRARDVFVPNMYDGEPEDIIYGLYPGQPFIKKHPASGAFETVNSQVNPSNAMAVFAHMQQMTQSLNAGLIQAGVPSGRGRQTATEVNYAQQQAGAVVAAIMDGMVETALLPLVRRSMYLIIEKMTIEEWKGNEIKWLLGSDERDAILKTDLMNELLEAVAFSTIDISAPGRSLERQVTLEGLTQLFAKLQQIAPGWLNIQNVVGDLTRLSGLDGSRYLNKEFNLQAYSDYLIQTGRGQPILDQMAMERGMGQPGQAGQAPGQPPPTNVASYNPGPRAPGLGGL